MGKWLAVALAVLLVVSPALASPTELAVENLSVAVETTMGTKGVEDVSIINAGLFGHSGELRYSVDEVDFTQMLAIIGYEINANLTPYAIIGSTGIELNRNIVGRIDGYSLPLLSTNYDSNGAFTWGVGLKGELIELPQEVKLNYDVRFLAFDDDERTTTTLLPGYCGIGLDSTTDVESMEWDLILTASRRFELGGQEAEEKPIIRAVTPSVGFKYTDVDLNIKNTIGICDDNITVGSEQNIKADLYSAVVGVGIEVLDNWKVDIFGAVGGEQSVGFRSTYSF